MCCWNIICRTVNNCNMAGMKELEETFSEGYSEGFSQGVRHATMLACEALYVLQDEINADLMDIEEAQEIMKREIYEGIKNTDTTITNTGELFPKGSNQDGNGHDNH